MERAYFGIIFVAIPRRLVKCALGSCPVVESPSLGPALLVSEVKKGPGRIPLIVLFVLEEQNIVLSASLKGWVPDRHFDSTGDLESLTRKPRY